jgi:hypothetical protein
VGLTDVDFSVAWQWKDLVEGGEEFRSHTRRRRGIHRGGEGVYDAWKTINTGFNFLTYLGFGHSFCV